MAFRYTGLDIAPFRNLFALSDTELAARGIRRVTADAKRANDLPAAHGRAAVRDGELGAVDGVHDSVVRTELVDPRELPGPGFHRHSRERCGAVTERKNDARNLLTSLEGYVQGQRLG